MKLVQLTSRAALLLFLLHATTVNAQLKLQGIDVLPSVTINDEVAKIHTQGLHVTEKHYLVTGRLEKRPKRALLLRFDRTDLSKYEFKDITPEVIDGENLDHPGGFDVGPDGGFWIPLSTSHRKGPSKICRFEIPEDQPLSTAKCVSSFSVDDHIGAVCCMSDKTLYGANWDTVDLHAWKPDGAVIERVAQAKRFAAPDSRIAVQDWKHFGDDSKSIIMGGLDKTKSPAAAVVRIADIKQGKVLKSMTLAPREDVKRPLTNEGMAVLGRTLYLLPEDIGKGAKVLKFAMGDEE